MSVYFAFAYLVDRIEVDQLVAVTLPLVRGLYCDPGGRSV